MPNNSSCAVDQFSLPLLSLGALYSPPSPSDSSSTCSNEPTLPVQPLLVVCNVPLVAPVPLPYLSPSFLHFELPDLDQDLSHPPYTRPAFKRKLAVDEVSSTQPSSRKRFVLQSSARHHHSHHHNPDNTSLRHRVNRLKRSL